MRQPPDTAERRPRREGGAPEDAAASGIDPRIPQAGDIARLIAERREAWQAGVLDGYAAGWRDGLRAGIERGTAG
jgi:hypothetical protein